MLDTQSVHRFTNRQNQPIETPLDPRHNPLIKNKTNNRPAESNARQPQLLTKTIIPKKFPRNIKPITAKSLQILEKNRIVHQQQLHKPKKRRIISKFSQNCLTVLRHNL